MRLMHHVPNSQPKGARRGTRWVRASLKMPQPLVIMSDTQGFKKEVRLFAYEVDRFEWLRSASQRENITVKPRFKAPCLVTRDAQKRGTV